MSRHKNHNTNYYNDDYEPPHGTCPTGALLEAIIFEPEFNEWREPIRVDEEKVFDHPIVTILLPGQQKAKKLTGREHLTKRQKMFSKPIPNDSTDPNKPNKD